MTRKEHNYWRNHFNKRYYVKNDKGHQIDHIDAVYNGMMELNDRRRIKLDTKLIFFTAYCHDLFTHVDRDLHHELAKDYVLKYHREMGLNDAEGEIVAMAVYEHRSSTGCSYSNEYSKLIQIADKGKPILYDYIRRSFKYNSDKHSGREEIAIFVLQHLRDKFGRNNGYGFKCDFYREAYHREISIFHNELDLLEVDTIIEICKDIEVKEK